MGLFDKFKKNQEKGEKIYNCVKGNVIPVTEVKDETFSSECLGKGVGVIPVSTEIVAPVNGEVTMVFPTKHALALKTKSGVEILIHIGLDTVDLEGKPFKSYIKKGDKVKKGQLLIEADFDEIKKMNCDTTTMMVVANSKDFSSFNINVGQLNEEDVVMEVER